MLPRQAASRHSAQNNEVSNEPDELCRDSDIYARNDTTNAAPDPRTTSTPTQSSAVAVNGAVSSTTPTSNSVLKYDSPKPTVGQVHPHIPVAYSLKQSPGLAQQSRAAFRIPTSNTSRWSPSLESLHISQSLPLPSALSSTVAANVTVPISQHIEALRMRQTTRPFLTLEPPSPTEATCGQDIGRLSANRKAVENYFLTHTPPDDSGTHDWNIPVTKVTEGSDENQRPTFAQNSDSQTGGSGFPVGVASGPSMASDFTFPSGRGPWLGDALGTILSIVHSYAHTDADTIKILSHALPSPSTNGHAFPAVIEAIQQSTSSTSIEWMNVWHAVSGRFSFEDLPKSPPTTPAPPYEGDDYFTQRVFDYAVEVPDYSQKLTARPLTPSQRPAIAPSSIDVSVVERYIPPTTSVEFDEMFSTTGRSLLYDRLIELNKNHGTLLFIYPTKAGALRFKREYLSPVLDPTLRSMMVMHDLKEPLMSEIGGMPVVDRMLPFDDMRARLQAFLNELNNPVAGQRSPFSRHAATYSVMYAEPQEVYLSRSVWAKDWWNKQEKLRIQATFENHDVQAATGSRQAGQLQASKHLASAKRETQQAAKQGNAKLIQRAQTQSLITAAERSRGERQPGHNEQMILHLLEQVAKKPYKNDEEPADGIEVGVFVIQKAPRAGAPIRPTTMPATAAGA